MAGSNIAIDLGTSTVTVYMTGKGIVYKQANAVAVDRFSGQVVSIGDEAAKMLEKTRIDVIEDLEIFQGQSFYYALFLSGTRADKTDAFRRRFQVRRYEHDDRKNYRRYLQKQHLKAEPYNQHPCRNYRAGQAHGGSARLLRLRRKGFRNQLNGCLCSRLQH